MKKVLFLILTLLLSCNSSLKKYHAGSECSTVISGEVKSSHKWSSAKDCLFFKKHRSKALFGEIIEMKDDGVLFNPDDEPMFKRPTSFYPFEELKGVIDYSGKILFGTIPKKYCNVKSLEVVLSNQDSTSEQSTIKLSLNANEHFSYCLHPGTYKLENLTINTRKSVKHRCTIIPDIEFIVEKGHNNFLGAFKLNMTHFDNDDSIILGYKLNDGRIKITDKVSLGPTITGFNLLYDFSKSERFIDIDGIHILSFSEGESDENIALPLIETILKVTRNNKEKEIKDSLRSKQSIGL